MLIANDKQVTVAELSQMLGIEIPVSKILKNPAFEISPERLIADPANGQNAKKHRASLDFPAKFSVRAKNGKDVVIRYAQAETEPRIVGDQVVKKYLPKMVEFQGKDTVLYNDDDKAIYFWLHRNNETSPFRDPSKPFEYTFVDNEKRAQDRITSITDLQKALTHAANLKGLEAKIIAKGLKIPNVDTKEEIALQADLMTEAQKNPQEYLKKVGSQVTRIDGEIVDSIDKGIFEVEEKYGAKRWVWAKGVKQGEFIMELTSKVQDKVDALKNHIKSNLNEFLPILRNEHANLSADEAAEQYLKTIEAPVTEDVTPVYQTTERASVSFPTTFNEVIEYIQSKSPENKRPSNSVASPIWNGIKEGKITIDNIDDYVSNL